MTRENSSWRTVVSICTLVVSVVSLLVSLRALHLASQAERRAYDRVVDELRQWVAPVYRDAGLKPPATRPRTISEVLTPLYGSLQKYQGDSASQPY